VFSSPCGTVLNLRELSIGESKSQVYGHLHDILSLEQFNDISKIYFILLKGDFSFCGLLT